MNDIFISYAKEDRYKVKLLVEALADNGLSIWWDRTIPAGKTWREVIGEALETARLVIVVWSKTSVKSRWVQEEADRGLKRNILVPVLIDNVDPPLGFGNIQAADLVNWVPSQSSPEFEKLISDIRIIINSSQTTPITPEVAEDKTKQAEPEFSEPRTFITKPPRKGPVAKIGVLISLAMVIVAGAMLLFWQEPTKQGEPQKSPQTKVKEQEKKSTRNIADIPIPQPMPSPAKSQTPDRPAFEITGKVQESSDSFDLPQPKIFLLAEREEYPAGGRQWISYKLAVTNWASYPADLFKPAPDLPPCGLNKNSSRTWVAIYDAIKKVRIYGYCGLSSPQDLNGISFSVEKGNYPPKAVYVEFEDRRKRKKYISNTVEVK